MFKETPSFDNLSNLGFNVNPNMQDSTLRAMNTREQKQLGMYYWANSDRDQEAAKKARDIFGRGMVNITDKENAAYYAGLSELQDMGIANTPYAYFIKHNIPIPENLETDEDVYMYIGQKTIDRNRALKDATQKASEDLNELGEELPIAIASAVRGEELDVSKTFNPELREKLMELQEWDGVEQSLKRAQTAWLYMASYMGSPEDLRAANREDLRYIADSLKDDSGNIDERAMAAFQIAVESRAKEMQSWDGNFWKNVGFGLEDVSERWSDYFSRPDEPNADEERLYGTLLSAINTSVQAAEGTSNISKTLASFGYMTGEMTPALIAGAAASGASAVAGAGLIASAITAGVTTSATTYVPTANQAIASAYVQGKENPELQGRIEGAAEAAVEGLAGTIPGGIIAGKVAGKFITKAASYAAGSRLLSNTVTQSTLRFFGGNTLQGLGELAEEEVGSALSAGLNATFRAAGYNLTPEQYNFGKTWGEMPAHQVAAIFCYTSALGLFGLPTNIKASREFARNSNNLLMVGHSEAAARDITEKQYQADAEKESIITSDISIEEKAEKLAAIDERMDAYRADKYRSDVMEATPEEIDRRKKRENDDFMLATEAMMYIQNGVAERALERANITASIPTAGDKITFLLENKDSKTGEIKMEKRTVTKKQFASWLMTERNKELRQSMRNFQSQLAAKKLIESVQSSDDIKHEIINLHDAPAKLITELKNHEAITITTLQLLADHAKNEIANLRAQGMSEQQARMQSSSLFKGVQLQHVAGLVKASQERQENEAATTSGNVSGITTATKIEHPAFRLPRMDGTSVIVYAEGRAGVNHIVEELLESHLAQELASGTTNLSTLAEQLKTIEKQLPGKIKLLPEGKKEYKFGDIVEAYSKIAQANFLYNEAYLPLDKGGHRLVQNILRNVQAARIYKVLGEAYKNFANSEKGKAYLANGGKSLVDIMNAAGFTLGSRFEAIQQEADKAVAEMEARNLLPSPKQEAEQLIQAAKDQQELAEINAKEADEPIVVTTEESITGEREELLTNDKLTEAPEEQQAELSEEEKRIAKLRTPDATIRDFADYFKHKKETSEAEDIEMGLCVKTQTGETNPAYIVGKQLGHLIRVKAIRTEEEIADHLAVKLVDDEIVKVAGRLVSSSLLKKQAADAKKLAKTFRDEANTKQKQLEHAIAAKSGSELPLPEAPKWPKAPKKKEAPTQQELVDAVSVTATKDKTRYVLNNVSKENVNGVTYYVATDGRRLSLLSHKAPKGTPDSKVLIDIATQKEHNNGTYVNWRQVMPTYGKLTMTVDLTPLLALKKLRKKGGALHSPAAKYDNVKVTFDSETIYINAQFIREMVEQVADLTKKFGFPSTVKMTFTSAKSPVLFSAEHNGLEWKCLIMPFEPKENAPENSIVWAKKPYLETRKNESIDKDRIVTMKDMADFAEAKAQEMEVEAAKIKQQADDVAILEKQLPHIDRSVREIAGTSPDIDYNKVRRISVDFARGNLSAIMRLIPEQTESTKWARELFEKISGLTLPGTPEGNKAMAEKWAAEQAAKGTPIEYSNTNQDSGSFSIAATDNLEQRFAGNPLAERMSFYLHREAKRFARILGNKTPYDTAVNAIASANAVIGMLDKYVHTNKIPLGRDERARLGLLQRLIEKYAQIIKVGGARSFNKISKAEQGVLDNILSEISTGIEEGQTKANAKERYQELVRQAAKGRVWALLSEMMIEAGDILDAHLKSELQEKMKRITKGVKIKRTPSKKLKGKMTAAGYRDLEQAIVLMDMSQRAKQDEEEAIDKARRYLIDNVGEPIETLRDGTTLLTELAERIERNGQKVTEENLNQQLTYYSNAVQIFGDIESKDYKQTKAAAAALFMLVNYHRTKWQEVQEAKTAHVKAHLKYFLDNTTSEMGRDNFMREVRNKANRALTFLPDSMMNTAQLFLALASFKGLQPLFNEIRYSLANAQTAREVHLRNIRQQELAAFGQIIGIKPAAKAGYTERQLGEISDKFDSFYQENNQTHQTDIVVKWMAEKSEGVLEQREEKLKATNWELLGIILNYRQPHYKTNAALHGFTQDVLDKIEAHIGEKLMTFGNAIQQIIVNDGTMQVYEEREGVPMRDEPLYFPGSININTLNTTREEPLTHSYHPTAMHDFLHVRVRHRDEIKATNAYAAYRSAIADRANYIYLDPSVETIIRLLAHKEFSNRLESLIGPNLFKQLRATIGQIKGAGHQETSIQDTSGWLLTGALSAKSIEVLSGNTASHIRQLSAVANAGLMPDISPMDILKYVNLARSGKGRISIAGVMKLDAFETRRRDNSFVNEMAAMDNNVKYSKLLKLAKSGLNTMDKLDALANAVSATVVYNHKYDQLKAMGHLSESEIEKRCEQEVNTYVRLLAQPLNKMDKSALYWMISNWAIGRSLLFMSSDAVNKVGMLRANYIIKRNNGQTPVKAAFTTLAAMGLSVGLASFFSESIIAGLTGNLPDDDDSLTAWAIATYLNATIGQYLETMPLVGAFSRQIFSPYGKLQKDLIVIPGSEFEVSAGKLWKMLTDDKDYSGAEWQKQITRFMRELSSVLGYAGGAYSRWQLWSSTSAMLHSMTTVLNSVYFVAQAATNKAEWTEILPESYTTSESDAKKIRQGKSAKPKRMKSAIEEWLTPESEKKAKKSKSGKTSKKTEVSKLLLL